MVPGPVEGDSQSSGDSSLSSVPADAFDDAPALNTDKPSTLKKMAKLNTDKPTASGDKATSSQAEEVVSIVVSDIINTGPESAESNQPTQPIPSPEDLPPARATRSSTRPKIKIINKNNSEDTEAKDEIMVKGKSNGPIKTLLQGNKWTEQNVLAGGKKSPLNDPNDFSKLRDILASDAACDALSPVARAEILSMLPASLHRRDPNDDQIKPNAFALRNSDDFRADAVRFKDDLENGYHAHTFLEDAVHARWQRSWHQRDVQTVKAFKHEWQVDLPDEVLPVGLENGRLREAKKPVDLRRVDSDEEMDVFLEAKATMEETRQAKEDQNKGSELVGAVRPVPIVRYAPPKSVGGKPKHKIALVKVPYDASTSN